MPRPDVERLFMRVADAETLEDAEAALEELAALDAADASAVVEHPPIGDLFSELAGDWFEEEQFDEAVRLQRRALEHPCTNRRREQGALLGYRFVGLEDATALDDLAGSRSGGVSDASLLSGFAEQVELVELSLALRLHDEALEIAKDARPPDDHVIREVTIARALARADADFPPDEDDLAADGHLAELEAEAALVDAREARQLFVPRDGLRAAQALWPEAFEPGEDDDAYYWRLERRWQDWPPELRRPEPYPADVEVLRKAGAALTRLLDDLPNDVVLAIEASGAGPVPWPPGRNEDCWCGSGRKYKRCCGR